MEPKVGIIYSSVDGQTKKISEEICAVVKRNGISAELFSIENFSKNITEFNFLAIGASVRYGKHHVNIQKFVLENKFLLSQIHTTFFSVNLVARKEEKSTPETNPYLIKFLEQVDWMPNKLAVFAGKLDYSKYSFWDSMMIKLIMLMTHGPTNSSSAIEFTNWEKVRSLGEEICRTLKSSREN